MRARTHVPLVRLPLRQLAAIPTSCRYQAVSRRAHAGTLKKPGLRLVPSPQESATFPGRLHSPPAHGPAQVLVPSFARTAPVLEKGLLNNYVWARWSPRAVTRSDFST